MRRHTLHKHQILTDKPCYGINREQGKGKAKKLKNIWLRDQQNNLARAGEAYLETARGQNKGQGSAAFGCF